MLKKKTFPQNGTFALYGVYFQWDMLLSNILSHAVFSGLFRIDETAGNGSMLEIEDNLHATLSNVEFDGNTLSFQKTYYGRKQQISYTFERNEDPDISWDFVGKWEIFTNAKKTPDYQGSAGCSVILFTDKMITFVEPS